MSQNFWCRTTAGQTIPSMWGNHRRSEQSARTDLIARYDCSQNLGAHALDILQGFGQRLLIA